MGSSAKSRTGGREIQTASQQGELVFFHPWFCKGSAINKDLTKLCFACTAAILIIATDLVDLLYFLHGKSAAVNVALGSFYITEIHIIVIF